MLHHIPFDDMERFMIDVFRGVGVPEEDARICADVLITSDKRGIDSHGIGRLKPIYYDRIVHQKIQQPVTERAKGDQVEFPDFHYVPAERTRR